MLQNDLPKILKKKFFNSEMSENTEAISLPVLVSPTLREEPLENAEKNTLPNELVRKVLFYKTLDQPPYSLDFQEKRELFKEVVSEADFSKIQNQQMSIEEQMDFAKHKNFNKELLNQAKFDEILEQPYLSRQQYIHYCRFRIYLIIAWYSGLRVNEIGSLTKSQIKSLILGQPITISSVKKNRSKILFLPQKARELMSSRNNEIETIFQAQTTLAGTLYKRNFIRFVNSCLRRATKDLQNPLTSESIRNSSDSNLISTKTTFSTQQASKTSVVYTTTLIEENTHNLNN